MTPVLSVQRLARSYGRRVVLRDVSFSAPASHVLGIIGPNGAGKTTLLRVIAGLQRADAGVVHVRGQSMPQALRHTRVAYFAGERSLPPAVRSHAWARLFHGADVRTRNEAIGLLSRGMRQALGLEAIFSAGAADLVLLDEPWDGLDPDAARWLTGAIGEAKARGAAVLVSSHRLHDLAAVCDTCVFLDRGTATVVAAGDLHAKDGLSGDLLLAAFDAIRRRAE
jgi:ABC-2 type transport system ATP-binding protein